MSNIHDKRGTALKVLKREIKGIVLYDLGFNGGAYKKYEDNLNGLSEREHFNCFRRDVRINTLKAKKEFDYSIYYNEQLPQNAIIDEWGIAKYINEKNIVHSLNPMKEITSIEELESYPFPDYTRPECIAGIKEKVTQLKKNGFIVVGMEERFIFAMGRDLRGFENHLMDYYLHPEFCEKLLDKILECQVQLVRNLSRVGVDIIWLSSDVASQTNLLISPDIYKKFISPRMKVLYQEAKKIKPDIICAYHCCGNVEPIIDEIIDWGVDILNPVQPESLNLKKFKKDYGEKLILWGGLSMERTLPFGSIEDVRKEVRSLIDTLGEDGGYIISPANEITEDIPWHNIEAFIDEAEKYGRA